MTEAALLASVGSTLFMVGLTWFVQAVHYPLFAEVGRDSFDRYHASHSIRVTWLVAAPMLVELASSVALAFVPPDGEALLASLGAVLAISVWVVTLAWAAPTHSLIGREGPTPEALERLDRASLVRSVLWTLHGVVVLAILARVIDLP